MPPNTTTIIGFLSCTITRKKHFVTGSVALDPSASRNSPYLRLDHLINGKPAMHNPYEVNGSYSAMSRMVVLEEWPDRVTVETYSRNGHPISARHGTVWPGSWMVWNVDFEWIMSFLRGDWWDRLQTPEDLKPKLRTGLRLGYSALTQKTTCIAGERSAKVPRGYKVVSNGLVLPGGRFFGDFVKPDDLRLL